MNKKLKSGLSREFFDYSGNSKKKNSLSKNFTKKLMLSAFAATTALVPCYEAGAALSDLDSSKNAPYFVSGGGGGDNSGGDVGNPAPLPQNNGVTLDKGIAPGFILDLSAGDYANKGGFDLNGKASANQFHIRSSNNIGVGAIYDADANSKRVLIELTADGKTISFTGEKDELHPAGMTANNYNIPVELKIDSGGAHVLTWEIEAADGGLTTIEDLKLSGQGANKTVINVKTSAEIGITNNLTLNQIALTTAGKSFKIVGGNNVVVTTKVNFTGKDDTTFEYVNNTANPTTLTVTAFTTTGNNQGNVVIGSTGGGTVNVASDIKGSNI